MRNRENENAQKRRRYREDHAYRDACIRRGVNNKQKYRKSIALQLPVIDGEPVVDLSLVAIHTALSVKQLFVLERQGIIPQPFRRTRGLGKCVVSIRELVALEHAVLTSRISTSRHLDIGFDLDRLRVTLNLTWPYPWMLPPTAYKGIPTEAFQELVLLSLRHDRDLRRDRLEVSHCLKDDEWLGSYESILVARTKKLVARDTLSPAELEKVLLDDMLRRVMN